MRPSLFAALLMLVAVPATLAQMQEELRGYRADADAARAEMTQVIAGVVEGTNAFRKKNDLRQIKTNDQLTATAQAFAEYMAKELTYGHEADGRTPAQRAEAQKYDYCIVLENIAFSFKSRGYETAPLTESFVQGWIDSPPHRKNMLDPDVTEIGVGVARSENGVYFGVQMFGRPKSAAINIKVENKSRQAISYSIGDERFDLPPRTIRTHGVCRPPTIAFDVPQGSALPPAEKLSPTKATTYTVTTNGGSVEIRAS
jgi:uncharacterized protein YkwD